MGQVIDFQSRSFGKRLTLLFVVRSLAIWSSVVGFNCLVLFPVFRHGTDDIAIRVIAAVVMFGLGLFLQLFAVNCWKQVDHRMVSWNEQTETLSVHHHRLFRGVTSFGTIVEEFEFQPSDIRTMKVTRGRGRHIRLCTSQGFLCLTNDLGSFDQLCQLVENNLATHSKE